jgi:hypothetical protein
MLLLTRLSGLNVTKGKKTKNKGACQPFGFSDTSIYLFHFHA